MTTPDLYAAAGQRSMYALVRVIALLGTALLTTATLSACGGDGDGAAPVAVVAAQSFGLPTTATFSGSVTFPSGVTVDLATLGAVNGFGTVPVSASGTFTVDTYSSDAQYAEVITAAGTPLLCGWLGTAEPVINTQTTAEVYVYLATFAYTLPNVTDRADVMASIASLAGLASVEQAISAALTANPTANPASNAAVIASISTVVTDLQNSASPAAVGIHAMTHALTRGRTSSLLINPGTTASGITLIDDGQNNLSFQNTLRRGAAAYIDEVSHVDASGTIITDNAPDTAAPVTITAETAIGSFGGTLSNYLNGAYAFTPTTSGPFEVPNLSGAQSTTYRVAIVGPGASKGNFAALTEAEQDMVVELTVKQVVFEVTLPLIASVLIPNKELGESILESPAVDLLLKDTLNVLASTNAVSEAVEAGDLKGVYDAISAALAGNVTLVEPLLQAVAITALNLQAGAAVTAYGSAAAKTLVAPLMAVDTGIAFADALIVIHDDASADQGDVFSIVSTDPTTTLTPATSSIAANATVTLTAALHPGQTGIVYQYTNTALFGHLTPTVPGAVGMDNFSSSSPTVTYTGNATGGGTDTITVTPQLLVTGQDPTDFKTASATVAVNVQATPTFGIHLATNTYSEFIPESSNGLIPARTVYYIYVFPFYTFQTQQGATNYKITNSEYLYSYNFTAAQIAALPSLTDQTGFPSDSSCTGDPDPASLMGCGNLPAIFADVSSFGTGLIGIRNASLLTSPPSASFGGVSGLTFVEAILDPYAIGLAGGSSAEPTAAQLNAAISSLQANVMQQLSSVPAAQLPILSITY